MSSIAPLASVTGKRGGRHPSSNGAAPITNGAASTQPTGAAVAAPPLVLHQLISIALTMDKRAAGDLTRRSSVA